MAQEQTSMAITLYVLRSRCSGKRYVGITNNLARRLREHSRGKTKAGEILSDFKVVYTEDFADHAAARAREKALKGGQGRRWLDEVEEGSWPA